MEKSKATILIVDDIVENIHVLMNILKKDYLIQVAKNGQKAMEIIHKNKPDLILLDIMMPELSGYDVIKILKKDVKTENIPVIFVTAMGEVSDEAKGLALGAVDYISKPVIPELVLSRVRNHLLLKKNSDQLELLVHQRTKQLEKSNDSILIVMGLVAENRDPETGEHIQRTSAYVRAMSEALSKHPQYQELMTPDIIDIYTNAAPLHDIGKVGVADNILLKPGKLTTEEFELMKQHAIGGEQIIEQAQQYLSEPELLDIAKEIAGGHHEKWDGSGYPRGLKGEQIPLSARIMVFADVYDALISNRPYKKAFSHEKACEIIANDVGTHFDPTLYAVFTQIKERFREIAVQFSSEKEGVK